MIDPTPGADVTPIAGEIVAADPDVVFTTTTPGTLSSIYGAALASNFEAVWTGNGPNWNPGFIAPDSPIKDAIARDWVGGVYVEPWGGESEGIQQVMDLMGELRSGRSAQRLLRRGIRRGADPLPGAASCL